MTMANTTDTQGSQAERDMNKAMRELDGMRKAPTSIDASQQSERTQRPTAPPSSTLMNEYARQMAMAQGIASGGTLAPSAPQILPPPVAPMPTVSPGQPPAVNPDEFQRAIAALQTMKAQGPQMQAKVAPPSMPPGPPPMPMQGAEVPPPMAPPGQGLMLAMNQVPRTPY